MFKQPLQNFVVNHRETIDPYLKESRVLRAVPANTREVLNDLKGSKITQHAKYCCFFAVFFLLRSTVWDLSFTLAENCRHIFGRSVQRSY